MKKAGILLLVLILHTSLFAQQKTDTFGFKIGEKLHFKGYYNLGILWIPTGEVRLRTIASTYKNYDAVKIVATGRNFNAYNYIYRLRDTLTCYTNTKTFRPYFFEKITNEGKTHRMNRYWFTGDKIRSQMQKKGGNLLTDTILNSSNVHDLLSVAYYARSLNYEACKINQKIPIKVLINNKIYSVYIRYKGIETIKSDWGKFITCYKISPLLVKGNLFNAGEGMNVWLSKNHQRLPIMVEAKVLVGKVKGMLQQ